MAVRRWGGEVHEVGIGLLFLIPAPYVDASAASRLQRAHAARGRRRRRHDRRTRVWRRSAWSLWLLTQPGLVHDIAFVVMLIGSVSTLLFNGNPLLRFDAYHVMCDLFDLPNLAARSGAWWSSSPGALAAAAAARSAPAARRSERKWLWLYAPLSLALPHRAVGCAGAVAGRPVAAARACWRWLYVA